MSDINKIIEECKVLEDKYGYFIHCVQEDDNEKFIEFHTHGLIKYNHLELQVLGNKFSKEISCAILNKLSDLIINRGFIFKDKECYLILINSKEGNFTIKIKIELVKDSFEEDILRILILEYYNMKDSNQTIIIPITE